VTFSPAQHHEIKPAISLVNQIPRVSAHKVSCVTLDILHPIFFIESHSRFSLSLCFSRLATLLFPLLHRDGKAAGAIENGLLNKGFLYKFCARKYRDSARKSGSLAIN